MTTRDNMDLNRAQLFLDDFWVEESTFVSRQWHAPRRFADPILQTQHPWERWCPTLYGTVMRWRGKFRMWYHAFTRDPKPRICYAESDDGVAWHKPNLGICEFNGSKANNIILQAHHPRYIDDIAVIDDPDDGQWPLKALFWEGSGHDWAKRDWGIFAARSKDGLQWDRSPGLVLPQWIDRFTASATRVESKYVVYGRSADLQRGMNRNGRSIWRTESADLVHWSDPELVLQRDAEDPVNMEYYSAIAFPYEGLTLGAIERMHMSPDRLDVELIWSRDEGRHWQRARSRPALLAPSPPRRWDDSWICLPNNGLVRHNNRLWLYYGGRSSGHSVEYPLNHGAIGLALMRIDGFASLFGGQRQGVILTRPIDWPGGAELLVNADPRRDLSSHPMFCDGDVRVEVRDVENKPIAGLRWDDSQPLPQTLDLPGSVAKVTWQNNRSIGGLGARPLRLAFRLRDAHLFSFRAADPDSKIPAT